MQTGITAIDAIDPDRPVGTELIHRRRQTGKDRIAIDTILNRRRRRCLRLRWRKR